MAVRIVEPVPMGARVRQEAVAMARRLRHSAGRAAFRSRLRDLAVASEADLRVCFGWLDDPARPEETRIGGAVKLAHLRSRFGESRTSFNILYLVSSVLHLVPHVGELVRWAKRAGICVVWNQNGVAYPAWCGSGYPWFNEPMADLIHRADHIVYQSEFCRTAADRYLGKAANSSEILWNPVDVEHFVPGSTPDLKCWQLLAMGTNHSFYRVKASIDCVAKLLARGACARLTIAGEMRWKGGDAEVAGYVQSVGMGAQVELRPRFSQAEAPALYRGAHVLLHPKYKDPCPTVPIEAMSCGVPVVGSRSGGMPELVSEDAGRLVDVEDSWTRDIAPNAEDLAEAVQTVMADHSRFSLGARERALRHFDRRAWVDRHETIFRDVLSRQ